MWTPTPFEIEALQLSLKVGLWSTVLGLPLALFMAWLLVRTTFPLKSLLDALVHLPLVLPPVVVGYLLLVLFGRHGVLGQWFRELLGIQIAFTWRGAVLAAAVMAFPLMVRAIRLSLENVDQGLEVAARTLGAGRIRVFLTITLPLILPGVIAAALLGFARALGEFGATITFVANIPGETSTLPLALYNAIQIPGQEDAVWRLLAMTVIVAIGAVLVSEWLTRRGRKALQDYV